MRIRNVLEEFETKLEASICQSLLWSTRQSRVEGL